MKNEISDITEEKPVPTHHKDIKIIVALLTVLYGIQGMIIGIVYETVPMIIKSKVSYTQLGFYMLSTYPFSLKILWCPLVDTYYFKSIGKRRTWIIFSQISCILLLAYLYFHIEYYIQDPNNLATLAFLCFSLNFSICSQDIAVDGWALTLLGEKNATTASSCQSFGQIIGVFLTTVVYFYLNSLEFCNNYIFSTPRESPMLDISHLCLFTLFVFVGVTLALILFFTEDFHLSKEELQEEEEISFTETMRRVFKIFKIKGIKSFIFLMLIKHIGMVYFGSIINYVFIDKGLSKTSISMISTLTIPFQLIFIVKFGQIKEKMMVGAMNSHFVLAFLCVFDMILLFLFDLFHSNLILVLIFAKNIFSSYFSLKNLICYQGFYNKIVDRSLGATYITLLNSIHNLSHKWPSLVLYPAIDHLGSTSVGIISIIISFSLYFLCKDKIISFEQKESDEWKIKKE